MNLACYIIDDEQAAIDLLARFVERTPGLFLAGSATNPVEALAVWNKAPCPDIIFSDIRMPELSGLALAGLLHDRSRLVFTTSYRDHASEAFELAVCDYLLKPIAYERFLACIQKIRARIPNVHPDKFFVRTGLAGELKAIVGSEIMYIAAAQNYVEIHTLTGRLTTLSGIGELLEYLPSEGFSRIHRSYIVNHAHITAVHYDEVELSGKTRLTIGRSYRAAFFDKISRMILPTQQRL